MSSINRTCSICDNLWPTKSVNEWPRTCEATPTPQENRPLSASASPSSYLSDLSSYNIGILVNRPLWSSFIHTISTFSAPLQTNWFSYDHTISASQKTDRLFIQKLVHTISSFSTPINKPTAAAAILIKNKITGNKGGGGTPTIGLFAVGVGVYGRYQALISANILF